MFFKYGDRFRERHYGAQACNPWHGIPIHTHQAKRIYLTIKRLWK
jgi:hypothetical protein